MNILLISLFLYIKPPQTHNQKGVYVHKGFKVK